MNLRRTLLSRIVAALLTAALIAVGASAPATTIAGTEDKVAPPIPIGDADGDGDVDLDDLARRIADSKAVGLLTKLSLKREIDALERDLKSFHDGAVKSTLDQLHERYDLLVHKLMSLLQEKDPKLARDVSGARDPLWTKLADPNEFRRM